MENSSDKESVELIQIDIVENSKEDQPPKTAKDLFSVFKVSDDSDYEPDENNRSDTDSDEPLSKRMKIKTKKQAVVGEKAKEPESADGSLKKKKYYSQKYKKEWEAIPSVKPWISESIHGPHYFYCRFCKKDYKCGKTEIFKHMSAMKHRRHLTTTTSGVQKFSFRGLLCPAVTPFQRSRAKDINYKLIGPYAKFLKACGVKGILLNDVMGEGVSLTPEERKSLTEYWVEICKEKNQFLMVQIGGAPLKSVIDMAIHAEKVKVGAIVLMPDLYNRPKNHLDLIRYIKIVSDYTEKVPILYHHYPKYTQINIDMSSFLLDITGEIDSFVGLIYSTNDLQESLSALTLNPEKFVVFMGTDEVMLGAVASGFTCIMGNSINILPKLAESICQCIKDGEIKSAQASQNLLKKALDNIYCNGDAVATMKAAISIITNLPIETVREPLQTVWEGTLSKMRNKLREIGII
ncbi:N-acetylneuraminate lyase isoform X2 [Anoplophora glabripennis]|uniref:N-acetylneuraminate lyase isoform X2 n=1 Tax=Anoplophora glabripennis TaxID=217634 RepID=UPI00087394A4|nr:N-acetylneuraminate lyase isoform X2 [Anoplophora glabripennis]